MQSCTVYKLWRKKRKLSFPHNVLKIRWGKLKTSEKRKDPKKGAKPDLFTGFVKRWKNCSLFLSFKNRGYRSRIFLMISSTVALVLGSRVMFFSTCWVAYTTVEWSRPPNSAPTEAMGSWVISRTTYMAI